MSADDMTRRRAYAIELAAHDNPDVRALVRAYRTALLELDTASSVMCQAAEIIADDHQRDDDGRWDHYDFGDVHDVIRASESRIDKIRASWNRKDTR
jgi:hypothetical protein